MTEKEFKKRVEEVKARFDKVFDVYETKKFTEVMGRYGGDCISFRVYRDGMVTER